MHETESVVSGIAAELAGLAKDIMSKGMVLEDQVLKLIVDQLRGRVVVALDLIADYLHLLVDLVLGIQAVKHDVRQQIHRLGEMLLRHGGIEHGVLLIGKGIKLAPHALQVVDHLQGTAPRRTLEGHVLTEVRQSLLARQFIARPSRNLITAIDHLRCRRQMDNTQPVFKTISVVFRHLEGKGTQFFLFSRAFFRFLS